MLDQTIGDTLASINVVRAAFGKPELSELPDARTGETQDCLYFRALSDCGVRSVGVGFMEFNSERAANLVASLWGTSNSGKTVESPKAVSRVIGAFDNNSLEHYNV